MHQPVMLKETIGSLNLKPGDIVLDATVGGGGHAREILKSIIPGGKLIGLDRDPIAARMAEETLKDFKNFKLINDNFRNLDRVLSNEFVKSLDAALFDAGVSSFQLDDKSRGFSLKIEAPLDMRMNPAQKLSAYDVVNRYKEKDIADIIYKFGEERFSAKIARFIARSRRVKPIETTKELADIVHKAIGFKYKSGRIDSATRTFQAIRIAVNDELSALEEGLKKAVSWLNIGGRIAVISFHSLEDRIAKNLFRGYSDLGIVRIVTKKPIRPKDEETLNNPRSRSGRLRVAERI
ncbi:MAG: 16S rRNA (cytosine(1402)-N(4))-methyltransferase RsmH [Candidatus Omnitrophota bacterium]